MHLHLQTLYFAGVTIGLIFAFAWVFICRSYRWLRAARYWLTACVLIAGGGSLLVAKAFFGYIVLNHLGMLTVMIGLACYWQGARIFARQKSQWFLVLSMVAVAAGLLSFAGQSYGRHNLVYTAGHATVLVMTLIAVVRHDTVGIGAKVAISSIGGLLASYVVLFSLNLARVGAMLSEQHYAALAPWFLAVIVLMVGTISLGFSLMTTDSLRARLAMLATHDELTGLLNRRGLRERAHHFESAARRRNTDVIVMMIDLDGFKAINDEHGHSAGDHCICHVAAVAKECLRKNDALARLGGDEFCILLPEASPEEATVIAGRISREVAGNPAQYKHIRIPLSASIGVSRWTREHPAPLFDSLSQADKAMYDAKVSGMSLCTIYDARAVPATETRVEKESRKSRVLSDLIELRR